MTVARSPLFVVAFLVAGCPDSHSLSSPDGGGPVPDTNPVLHDCYGAPAAGLRCDFTEPCRRHSDFWLGRCGTETWSCEAGRVVYTDLTFACSPPDAGPIWCIGYAPPATVGVDDCRRDADCGGGFCTAPGDTSGNHATGFCPMDCETDADCLGGICESLNGGSCHRCAPACFEGGCGHGETCGESGHCVPTQCLDGWICPPGSSCGLTGTPADLHGCAIVACASDADCGCGACVLGACALGPGRCDFPRP